MVDIFAVKPHVVSNNIEGFTFLFHGEGGTGKTSVSAEFEGHLIAAFEPGYKLIPGAMGIPMNKWSDFKNLIRQLLTPKGKESYKAIVIDTIGLAFRACLKHVAAQNGVDDIADIPFGKGYSLVKKEFEEAIMSLSRAGFGIVIIAHSEEKDDFVTKEKRVKVDIDKKAYAVAQGLVDFNFYLKKDGVDENGDFITTALTNAPGIESKCRVKLPAEFRFSYENIVKEINNAINGEIVEKGHEVTSERQNLMGVDVNKIPFEELVEKTSALAGELFDQAEVEVRKLITNILGHGISESTKVERHKVETLEEELKALKFTIDNA